MLLTPRGHQALPLGERSQGKNRGVQVHGCGEECRVYMWEMAFLVELWCVRNAWFSVDLSMEVPAKLSQRRFLGDFFNVPGMLYE